MNTPTLKEIQKGFLRFCHELHNDMCLVNGCTDQCPYAEQGDNCEVMYAYDVLTGKRNLDGMLVETSAKEPDATIKLPSWCKVGQWCYLYNELAQITDVEDGIGVWTLSPTQEEPYLTDYTRIHEALKPALPAWCKVGQWCFDEYDRLVCIQEVRSLGGRLCATTRCQEDSFPTTYEFSVIHKLKPVRFREYRTMEEAESLKGAWIEYDVNFIGCTGRKKELVIAFSNHISQVIVNGQSHNEWQKLNATIDGVPIGVPEVDEEAMKGE